MRTGVFVWMILAASVVPCRSEEAPGVSRGTCPTPQGQPAPIVWRPQNLQVASGDSLRAQVPWKSRGTLTSDVLALEPLRLYAITIVCRRDPGLLLTIAMEWTDRAGKPGARQMVWHAPGGYRVNYWPLSPDKSTYMQRFCLPAGATQARLMIEMIGNPAGGKNTFELYDLSMAAGDRVPLGPKLGPNLCTIGDMESASDAMPIGWTFWGARPNAKLLQKDPQGRAAKEGGSFLSIPAGTPCILAAAAFPIEPGRAYRLSFWARGKGDLSVGAHSLEAQEGQRVGDPQQTSFPLDSTEWREFEMTWFAEALHASDANIFFGITPRTEIHLDAIRFQRIDP